MNTSSKAPTTIATLSTTLYFPVTLNNISAATASGTVIHFDTPNNNPTPIIPENSVIKAPIVDTNNVQTESHAHPLPNVSSISSP